ncbi:amidohydrolase family protein [Williamsia sp.]|uniref:amidohydrolase family protein n=1 Tax=Williamsia sp. TaxID=1872085 RepID=UPI001A1CBD83|nr:amidohydrolase family protein [Williamsia sp.]MBJ7289056.1 amidohydrolase family protein [Williamsia sp.]
MGQTETSEESTIDVVQRPIFDAHFHIIDPEFDLIGNDGYFPPTFTAGDYSERGSSMNIVGGAIVSGSFQGFDQKYLEHSLAVLGSNFVGVTQLPATVSDEEILRLDRIGVRAIRFNVRRGGSESTDELDHFARRVHEVAGWHTELYADASTLGDLVDVIAALPSASIDHLGLSAEGLATLLKLVDSGVRVKATGFGRVKLDVAATLRAVCDANPRALMFGSDLPSTRADRPFHEDDLGVLADAVGEQHLDAVLRDNAVEFYRLPAVTVPT